MDFRKFFSVNKKTRNIILISCATAAVVLLGTLTAMALIFGRPEPEATLGGTTAPMTDAPTEAPTPAPTEEPTDPPTEPPKEERYTLSFVGDCTLGTHKTMMTYKRSFVKLVGENYSYPFQNVLSYFSADDCTFANLEGVFADSGTPADKKFTFRGPTAFGNILTEGSIEAVSIANNHSYDFGDEGYASTKQVLDEKGVHYAEQRSTTVFTTESGLTIGFYALYACNYDPKPAEIKEAVEKMRAEGAEIIIASIHWGEEGWYSITNRQKRNGHDLIDNGVDIVWGHHPHVLQKVEQYNGGYIYYSLGNFSFGGNHNPGDKDTAILQQEIIRTVDGEIKLGELKAIPCRLSSKTSYNDFIPTPYEEGTKEYNRAMSKLEGTYKGSSSSSSSNKETEPATTAPTEAPTDAPTDAPTGAPSVPTTSAPTEPNTEQNTEPPQSSGDETPSDT